MRLAYSRGIFPWPIEGLPLPWFSPPFRGILEYQRLHIPRSLRKRLSKNPFRFTINQAFSEVIHRCAQAERPGQKGTWITQEMITAYVRLHAGGSAHSVEAWNPDRQLVGGLYGVEVGGVFSAESMFHLESDASKACVIFLLEWLNQHGRDWMDIQMLTPHMEGLGAREVPRTQFLERLSLTHRLGGRLIWPSPPS